MTFGFQTLKEETKKRHLNDSDIVKKRRSFFLKNSLSGFLLLCCLVIYILSISYFPRSAKQITTLKVNFQDSGSNAPSGWLSDFGQAFGIRRGAGKDSKYIFGWINKADKKPLDFTKNGCRRNSPSDILLATSININGDSSKNFDGSAVEGVWEAQVANGNYDVTVTVGDDSKTDSRNCINIEGVSAIANFVPTERVKFKSATVTVTVADGCLTIDGTGGRNTKLNTVSVYPSDAKRPYIVSVNPDNTSVNVTENTSLSTNVLKLPHGGINNASITSSSVYLTEEATGAVVPAHVNGTGEGDAITLVPDSTLRLNTTYRFTITAGVKDVAGSSFIPYSSTFTTAASSSSALREVQFDKIEMQNTKGQHSTLTIGPDGKLYALSIDGVIKRFIINPDGTLQDPELLYSLQDEYEARTKRLAIGLTFDPSATASNLVAWVTHSSFVFQNGPEWDGKLSRLSGPKLEKVQDVIVHLPRSTKDHVANSIAFGPDGALYFAQGSNTAMGSADNTWGSREENLLSGSILRLDISKLSKLPLDAKTAEGGGDYNPYLPNAPLTIYASGIRNAYDLVWHSNGCLYVPTNGSAAGGNTPSSHKGVLRPDGTHYSGPSVPALSDVKQTEKDFLFRVVKGGYYGHPNPLRGEFVMNGGNPTPLIDPSEVSYYPVGTLPDRNWKGFSFDFHSNTSPNGAIEYKSNTFHGALKGKLLVVRYSQHDDIMTLTCGGANNDIISATEGYAIKGFSGFVDPLDLTEDTKNGDIYVSEFAGDGRITLLRPGNKNVVAKK
ncbi:Ig-like domain-containing protein [Segetibacter koreensis]|uniref:Ig-like domain-containing protein n=1 Tax=Segetibacter koreensis TaxID=398037 RepID=UPI00037CC5C6|nr:Ig-like domain-containing protein [Segetibacter koreensis]